MNLQDFFYKHNGYARMKDLKEYKFHTRVIAKAVEENIIEKIKPGLYKLVDYEWDGNSSIIDIVLEALKNYVNSKESDLNRLYKVAKDCKMREVMEPYIKVMVIE